jgi:excisionase family DNA binding protein
VSGTYQGERVVNIMQACALAGVSRRTIYNWLNAGRLRCVRTAGGAIRIVESSLWQGTSDNGADVTREGPRATVGRLAHRPVAPTPLFDAPADDAPR